MACGASLVGAVSVVALTLAGWLRGVLCRLSVALRARFFAVLRVLAFCFAAGLCWVLDCSVVCFAYLGTFGCRAGCTCFAVTLLALAWAAFGCSFLLYWVRLGGALGGETGAEHEDTRCSENKLLHFL